MPYFSVCLVRFAEFIKGVKSCIDVDTLVQRLKVHLEFIVVENIICISSVRKSYEYKDVESTHTQSFHT